MENYDVHMENCAKMNFKMSRRLTLPNIKTSELESFVCIVQYWLSNA